MSSKQQAVSSKTEQPRQPRRDVAPAFEAITTELGMQYSFGGTMRKRLAADLMRSAWIQADYPMLICVSLWLVLNQTSFTFRASHRAVEYPQRKRK